MSDLGGSGLDAIARDLARGAISRRAALRRFGGVALGAMLPSALFAESALARCPKERRCDGKCCPKHAHCKRGKCKCEKGFTKCGKKCRNLQTDELNCGSCGHGCQPDETCMAGECVPPPECQDPIECPDPGECNSATCIDGVCGSQPSDPNSPCTNGACDGNGNCLGICGDGVVGPGEACDGSDLNGQSCQSLGFTSGTLACSGDCLNFDTSGCIS